MKYTTERKTRQKTKNRGLKLEQNGIRTHYRQFSDRQAGASTATTHCFYILHFPEAQAEALLRLPGDEASARQLHRGERGGELPRVDRGPQEVHEGPRFQDLEVRNGVLFRLVDPRGLISFFVVPDCH